MDYSNLISDDDALLEISCAIVAQAIKDIKAIERIDKIRNMRTRDKMIKDHNEAVAFFKSKWYSTLTLGRDGTQDLLKIGGV